MLFQTKMKDNPNSSHIFVLKTLDLNYTISCQKYSKTSNFPKQILLKLQCFKSQKRMQFIYSLFVKSSRMKRRLKLFVYKVNIAVLCLRRLVVE